MKRSRFSFKFAKDVREALRKRFETAASQTLSFSINSLKVHNVRKKPLERPKNGPIQ